MTRKSLAGLVRMQKNIFANEMYSTIYSEQGDDLQQRVYEAVMSTFEICAKIVEGSKMVGYIDSGSEGGYVH